MKKMKSTRFNWVTGSLAIALALMSSPQNARANVYATDVQVNGSMAPTANVAASVGSPVSITYRLNQAATRGVTVKILNGSTVVASIVGGTAMGLNTVSWTPSTAGTYSVNITAAATGFPIWTQTSIDSNPGMPAYYSLGIDVDKNTNSTFYGRVMMGCAIADTGNANPFVPAFARQVGIYKMNADGTYADEGGFGNAGYTTDDGGNSPAASGQMPNSAGYDPYIIRIGEDDRCYWDDDSASSTEGKIMSCDMLATVNLLVLRLDDGDFLGNPDVLGDDGVNGYGVCQFDITGTATAKAQLWISDYGDYPNMGVWMFNMTGGPGNWAISPTDADIGTQVVQTSYDNPSATMHTSDLLVSGGGVAVDTNFDIFVSCNRLGPAVGTYDSMEYTNWHHGVPPPDGSLETLTYGLTSGQVVWGDQAASSTDYSWESIVDTVINSKTTPTLVALAMINGLNNEGASPGEGISEGVKVVNAVNASLTITSATLTGTTLAINVTSSSPYAPVLSQLSLVGSATVNGTYAPVAATFTGNYGVFQATTTASASVQFYQVVCPATGGKVVQVENSSGTVIQSLTNIDFANRYTAAAWDNVGNLYAVSTTTNCWRVWSPPGGNTNTTLAAITVTAN